MTPREAIMRHMQLIERHGTDAEKQSMRETKQLMIEAYQQHPDGEWQPDDHVRLPDMLVQRAARVARQRHDQARQWNLKDKWGARRSFEDEVRSVEGQFALCLLLGLDFGDNLNVSSARAHGNVGSNISAFTPKPGNVGLLITEKEKPQRRMFLMLPNGDHDFHCPGFCRAGEFMIDEYQRVFERWDAKGHKHVAQPFIVPPEMLSPIVEWWRS